VTKRFQTLLSSFQVRRCIKVLPDGAAVALLQAHEKYVYAPLKVGSSGISFFFCPPCA